MVIKSSSFLNAMSNPEQQAAQPNLPSVTATAFCKDLMLPLTRCGSTTLTCARETRPNNSSPSARVTGVGSAAIQLGLAAGARVIANNSSILPGGIGCGLSSTASPALMNSRSC